jgi:hypothetical protein
MVKTPGKKDSPTQMWALLGDIAWRQGGYGYLVYSQCTSNEPIHTRK